MLEKSLSLSVSALAATFFVAPAVSQEGFEEIVVTATKREQALQEVPVAVSVTSADTIEKAQILDILDLQSVVPSLRATQLQSSGNTNFVIRGFGNGANNPGIEPSVGVFIDGVYRSRSAAALSDLPNLQRVEVSRGPQSTLFGKNASAGVNQRDGFSTNLTDGSDYNERSRWNVRGQLLWTPRDDLSLRFIADHDEIDEACCGLSNLFSGPTEGKPVALAATRIHREPTA